MYLKASSPVIVPSTSFTVKACHSWKKENSPWKSNYSTVRLFFLFWSSLNFPSVFLCIIGCVIWPVGQFLVHSRSSLLPLYVNLFSYLVSKCWPNYWGIMLLVKGICLTEVPHTYSGGSRPSNKGGAISKKIFFGPFGPRFGLKIRGAGPPGHLSYSYDLSCGQLFCKEF